MAKIALMPPVFAGAVLAQAALALLGVLSLAPIKPVQGAVGSIIDLLMGTIGQSYALKTSAVRRNAIVRDVMKDLEWMESRCRRIVVVSHSQGAEIARQVLQMRRWPKVKRWVTFGSGILPLAALEEKHRSHPAVWIPIYAMEFFTVLMLVCLVVGLISYSFGPVVPGWPQLVAWLDSSNAIGLLFSGYVILLAISIIVAARKPPPPNVSLSKKVMAIWHDLFASHDPVPGGSLVDLYKGEMRTNEIPIPKQSRIFNTRSGLHDHTSYFDNTEQFIAPLALEMFELAGLSDCVDAAKTPLERAAHRRDWMTWSRMLLRFAALTAVGVAVYQAACGAGGHWPEWRSMASGVWSSPEGWWPTFSALWSGLIKPVLFDLKWAVIVSVGYLALRWLLVSRWSRCSAKCLYRDLASVLAK